MVQTSLKARQLTAPDVFNVFNLKVLKYLVMGHTYNNRENKATVGLDQI